MGESSISTLLLNFEKWGARSWDASFASSWSENLTSVKCVGEPDEESELASSVSVSLTASRAARNSLQGTTASHPPLLVSRGALSVRAGAFQEPKCVFFPLLERSEHDRCNRTRCVSYFNI